MRFCVYSWEGFYCFWERRSEPGFYKIFLNNLNQDLNDYTDLSELISA